MLFGNRVSHFPPFSYDEDDPAKECDDLRQRKVGVLLRRQTRMPVTSTSGAAHHHPRLYKADDHLKTLLQCWRKHCRSRNILTSHFIFSLSNSHRKLQHSQFRRLTYICFLIVLMHTYEFVMISFWSWWKHIFYFHVEVLWLRQKTFAVHQNWQKNKWNCRGEVKYARLLLGFNIFVSRYDIAFRRVVIFCILLHFTACERETVCSKLFDAYYWFWKTNYKMYSQVALYIL